jgi:hypothetical protein
MSSKAKKTIKSRLTPEQIRALIENFERQGQSIKDFSPGGGESESYNFTLTDKFIKW